jgi:hypothetical protein
MYINACATLSNTLLLAWGRLGSISAPLVNQPVVFTSAIERSGKMEGKIATAWPSLVTKEIHQVYR